MTIQEIDTKELQKKLYERLKPSGWADPLKTFILGDEFKRILDKLVSESQDNKHFTPKLKQVFRAFEECPYKDLNIIIVGQDPYPTLLDGVNVADGIAFSCSNTATLQPSLKYMLQEVEEQMYPDGMTDWNPDLKRWANQGILLLNTALTTTIGKTGSHYMLWQPFIVYVLDYLSWNSPGLIYAFLGKKAQEYMDGMPDNSWKFTASHPASAAYAKAAKWDSEGIFKKMSDQLRKNNNLEINW